MQKNLTARVLILSLGSVLQKGSTLLVMVFLVRLLTPEMYGTYQQVLYVGGIAYGLFASGLSASIYYFLPRLDGPARTGFMNQTMLLVAILGGASAILVLIVGPQVAAYFRNPSLQVALSYYAAYIFLWIGLDYFIPFLNASGRYVTSILFGLFDAITNAVFLLVPLWLGTQLPEALGILSLAAAFRYVLYLIVTRRVLREHAAHRTAGMLGEQVRYSMPLMVSGWTDLVGGYLDKIVVSLFYGPAVVAIYAVGTIPIPIWDIIAKPVNIVLRVKFAELLASNQSEQIKPIWWEAVRKQSMLVIPVIFLIWASADHIIRFLFTDVYEDSIWVLRIALLDKLLFVMSFSVFPLCMGRSDVLLKGSLVYATSNALFLYFLATPFGYFGPVTAGVLSQYVTISYYVIVTVRQLHIPLGVLIPGGILARVFGVNLVAALAAYVVGKLISIHIVAIAAAAVIYALIYFVGLKITGMLRAEEVALIKRLLLLRRGSAQSGGDK